MKSQDLEIKFCPDCGRWLPVTSFYFNSYWNKYEWVCKECFKKRIYKNKEARRNAVKRYYYKLKLDKNKWKEYIRKKRLQRYNRKLKEMKKFDKEIYKILQKLVGGGHGRHDRK